MKTVRQLTSMNRKDYLKGKWMWNIAVGIENWNGLFLMVWFNLKKIDSCFFLIKKNNTIKKSSFENCTYLYRTNSSSLRVNIVRTKYKENKIMAIIAKYRCRALRYVNQFSVTTDLFGNPRQLLRQPSCDPESDSRFRSQPS